MTENQNELAPTDEDIKSFIEGGEAPKYHTILEVWREILKHARDEVTQHVNAGWASKIVSTWPEVTYAQMENYRDQYFGLLIDAANMLDIEIESDPGCLSIDDPEVDAVDNAAHYKNLILLWQMSLQQAEIDWECSAPDAGVTVAAISEAQKALFGPTGVSQYLDNIGFQYTEADQAQLSDALSDQRGDR